jgi:hypothetical protein
MSDVARTRRLRALQAEWVYLDSTINDPAARIYGDCARELLAVLDTEEDRQERANCSIHPTGDHEWVCLTCLEAKDEPSEPIADTEGDASPKKETRPC